jgi:hypothetical protein
MDALLTNTSLAVAMAGWPRCDSLRLASKHLWTNSKVRHKLSYEAIGFYTLPLQIKFDTNAFRSSPSFDYATIKFDTTCRFSWNH